MALAVKAIPTLYGAEAIRLREEMEAGEAAYESHPRRNRDNDPFIIQMRAMLQRSGF